MNVLGEHHILNILAAVSVANYLGIDLKEISGYCGSLTSISCKKILKKGINGINVIDCSYSANPTGVISSLNYLKMFEGKKIVIMPCLIEVGKASKEAHYMIGKKIAEVCDLGIITTKDRFKNILQGVEDGGMNKSKLLYISSPEEIFKKIKKDCQQGDTILIEGRVSERLKNLVLKE